MNEWVEAGELGRGYSPADLGAGAECLLEEYDKGVAEQKRAANQTAQRALPARQGRRNKVTDGSCLPHAMVEKVAILSLSRSALGVASRRQQWTFSYALL